MSVIFFKTMKVFIHFLDISMEWIILFILQDNLLYGTMWVLEPIGLLDHWQILEVMWVIFILTVKSCSTSVLWIMDMFGHGCIGHTVIPRLTRFLWQPKNRVRRNSRYASLYYVKYFCKIIIPKNRVMQIIYSIGMYKTVLCKFFWTSSKIRAMENRAIENCISRGMPVLPYYTKTN